MHQIQINSGEIFLVSVSQRGQGDTRSFGSILGFPKQDTLHEIWSESPNTGY